MSDPINKRVLDYDTFNELPPNSYLLVDSESMGTGKVAPLQIGATYEIQDGAHSFTLVGSNGYTHTVDIPYDSVQMSYNDYDALTELEKMDGTNRFVPDCPTTELEPEIWQRVGRDPLTTDEKTVSKAINELDSRSKAVNGDAFSELVEYSKGDYCIYDNAMYTYIADTPSTGSWDALKWELTDIQTEFSSIKSNLTDLQVYSTTEKVVGTWTDGRPIYRKTYSGNAVKSGTVTLDTINTLDLIVGSVGSAVSDYNWRWTIPNGDTSGYANRLRFSTSTKQLQVYFDSNYNTSCTYNITVDYVKAV